MKVYVVHYAPDYYLEFHSVHVSEESAKKACEKLHPQVRVGLREIEECEVTDLMKEVD